MKNQNNITIITEKENNVKAQIEEELTKKYPNRRGINKNTKNRKRYPNGRKLSRDIEMENFALLENGFSKGNPPYQKPTALTYATFC